ncbi:MAG: tape measure protein [Gemmatales bacterium]
MSTSIGELAVQLTANSQPMVQDMKIAERALASFSAAGEKMGTSLLKLTAQGAAFGLGFTGISHVVESLKHGLEIVEQNEKAAVSFKVLLGSAEAAKDMLKDLKSFAGESGMRFADARAGAAGLLKFGFNPDEIKPMLKVIGDFSTISMDGQQESMQRIIQLFGVIKDQGSLTARNMKALAAEGVEPWKALGEQLGVTRQELKRLLEAGEIDSATGLFAIQGAMRDKSFGGMNEDAKRMSRSIEQMKKDADGIWADFSGWAVETLHVDKGLRGLAKAMKEARNAAKGIYTDGTIMDMGGDINAKYFQDELVKFKEFGGNMDKVSDDLKATLSSTKSGNSWLPQFQDQGDVANPLEKFISLSDAMKSVNLAELKAFNQETEFLLALDESDLKIQEQLVAQEKLKAQQREHATEQMEDYIAQLQVARDTYGMSEEDKKLAMFSKRSPGSQELEEIKTLIAGKKAREEQQKMMDEGIKITEQYRTEQEKSADAIEHMKKLYDAGAISHETWLRGLEGTTPVLKEFLKETKSLQEEIAKLQKGEEAFKLDSLQSLGANAAQLKQVDALMKQRDQLKEIKSLQDEAQKAIQDQLEPAKKLADEFERAKEQYLAGNLNDQQFEALVNKYGNDYMKTLGKDDPKFAGAVEAGSRESYSSMVAASASTMSARDVAQKQLDEAVKQTENLKAMKGSQEGNTREIVEELKRIGAFRVMTLGGP